MKVAIFILAVFAALCSVFAFVPNMPVPTRGKQFPTFPGQGPFNPRATWPYPMPKVTNVLIVRSPTIHAIGANQFLLPNPR
ncbi:unnamed protein product [Xylocopa violacea]|uniref:Abaecin n=1 Tax=Xylocopa violacea TaxID=135666 RepID=A0ABP1N5T2_XYLVO